MYPDSVDVLRFSCVPGCTKCCEQRGYVYLTEDDLRRAAAYLLMTPRAFERKYVYRTKYLLRLRKPRGTVQCPFFSGAGCSIHPAKPVQCRAYPFWPEMLEGPREWREAGAVCPGIGQGALIQIETAQRIATEMREAYPEMYPAAR